MTARISLFLAAVAVAVAVDVASYGSNPGSVVHVVTYLIVCSVAWRAASRLPAGPARRPWLLTAIALTSWFCGDLIELGQFYLSTVPGVGPADVFWLAGYPLMAVALAQMARRRAPGRLRSGVLDALALTVAVAAAVWQFIVGPTLDLGYSALETVVPALYPLGDVTLLAGVLFVALSPGARGVPTRLLLGAVLLFLAIDLSYNVLPFFLDYGIVERIGPLILLGNALIVAACLHPGRGELTAEVDQVPSLHPARVVFLGLALLTAPTLTLLHSGVGTSELVALAATATCSAFVLTRFTNAVREQERAQTQLAYQARHDPLTGLANRTSLDDRLHRLLSAPDRPVSVLYLDLDGFKDVNDRHGHEAGDRVLTTVATRLTGLVRAGDLVARPGGDEFVIVCPDLDAARITEVAAQILHEVARPVRFGDAELTVGVSVGVAVRGDSLRTPSELLRAADAGMYDAKRHGRGRWVLIGGEEPVAAEATPASSPR